MSDPPDIKISEEDAIKLAALEDEPGLTKGQLRARLIARLRANAAKGDASRDTLENLDEPLVFDLSNIQPAMPEARAKLNAAKRGKVVDVLKPGSDESVRSENPWPYVMQIGSDGVLRPYPSTSSVARSPSKQQTAAKKLDEPKKSKVKVTPSPPKRAHSFTMEKKQEPKPGPMRKSDKSPPRGKGKSPPMKTSPYFDKGKGKSPYASPSPNKNQPPQRGSTFVSTRNYVSPYRYRSNSSPKQDRSPSPPKRKTKSPRCTVALKPQQLFPLRKGLERKSPPAHAQIKDKSPFRGRKSPVRQGGTPMKVIQRSPNIKKGPSPMKADHSIGKKIEKRQPSPKRPIVKAISQPRIAPSLVEQTRRSNVPPPSPASNFYSGIMSDEQVAELEALAYSFAQQQLGMCSGDAPSTNYEEPKKEEVSPRTMKLQVKEMYRRASSQRLAEKREQESGQGQAPTARQSFGPSQYPGQPPMSRQSPGPPRQPPPIRQSPRPREPAVPRQTLVQRQSLHQAPRQQTPRGQRETPPPPKGPQRLPTPQWNTVGARRSCPQLKPQQGSQHTMHKAQQTPPKPIKPQVSKGKLGKPGAISPYPKRSVEDWVVQARQNTPLLVDNEVEEQPNEEPKSAECTGQSNYNPAWFTERRTPSQDRPKPSNRRGSSCGLQEDPRLYTGRPAFSQRETTGSTIGGPAWGGEITVSPHVEPPKKKEAPFGGDDTTTSFLQAQREAQALKLLRAQRELRPIRYRPPPDGYLAHCSRDMTKKSTATTKGPGQLGAPKKTGYGLPQTKKRTEMVISRNLVYFPPPAAQRQRSVPSHEMEQEYDEQQMELIRRMQKHSSEGYEPVDEEQMEIMRKIEALEMEAAALAKDSNIKNYDPKVGLTGRKPSVSRPSTPTRKLSATRNAPESKPNPPIQLRSKTCFNLGKSTTSFDLKSEKAVVKPGPAVKGGTSARVGKVTGSPRQAQKPREPIKPGAKHALDTPRQASMSKPKPAPKIEPKKPVLKKALMPNVSTLIKQKTPVKRIVKVEIARVETTEPSSESEPEEQTQVELEKSSRPSSALNTSRPGPISNTSRPGTAMKTPRSGTTLNTARPDSAMQVSSSGTVLQNSRPGTAKQSPRPGTARQSSRPETAMQISRPALGLQTSRPASGLQTSRPASGLQTSRLIPAMQSSRPGTAMSVSRPVSAKTSRPDTAVQVYASSIQSSRPASAKRSARQIEEAEDSPPDDVDPELLEFLQNDPIFKSPPNEPSSKDEDSEEELRNYLAYLEGIQSDKKDSKTDEHEVQSDKQKDESDIEDQSDEQGESDKFEGQLDEHESQLDEHDGQSDEHDGQPDEQEGQSDEHEAQSHEPEGQLVKQDQSEEHEDQLVEQGPSDEHEGQFDEHEVLLDDFEHQSDEHESQSDLERELEELERQLAEHQGQFAERGGHVVENDVQADENDSQSDEGIEKDDEEYSDDGDTAEAQVQTGIKTDESWSTIERTAKTSSDEEPAQMEELSPKGSQIGNESDEDVTLMPDEADQEEAYDTDDFEDVSSSDEDTVLSQTTTIKAAEKPSTSVVKSESEESIPEEIEDLSEAQWEDEDESELLDLSETQSEVGQPSVSNVWEEDESPPIRPVTAIKIEKSEVKCKPKHEINPRKRHIGLPPPIFTSKESQTPRSELTTIPEEPVPSTSHYIPPPSGPPASTGAIRKRPPEKPKKAKKSGKKQVRLSSSSSSGSGDEIPVYDDYGRVVRMIKDKPGKRVRGPERALRELAELETEEAVNEPVSKVQKPSKEWVFDPREYVFDDEEMPLFEDYNPNMIDAATFITYLENCIQCMNSDLDLFSFERLNPNMEPDQSEEFVGEVGNYFAFSKVLTKFDKLKRSKSTGDVDNVIRDSIPQPLIVESDPGLDDSDYSVSGGGDSPDLEFVYDDADTHANEIAELYSYTEQPELALNLRAFEEQMELYKLPPTWQAMSWQNREAVVMKLMDQLEVSNKTLRMRAARCILYIAQGCWAEVQSDAEQMQWSRNNSLLMYKSGIFGAFVQLLNIEVDNSTAMHIALRKMTVSLNDSVDLRTILSVLYTIVEVIRCEQLEGAENPEMVEALRAEICNPESDEILVVKLLGMVTKFCSGSTPHFPMKKVLLLLWKVLLVSLGGMETLREAKKEKRAKAGLGSSDEDTMEVAKTMRASSPPASASDLLEAQNPKRSTRPFRRQSLMKQSSLDDHEAMDLDASLGNDNGDDMNDMSEFYERRDNYDNNQQMYAGGYQNPPGTPPPVSTSVVIPRGLPWKPKVRQKEIDTFLDTSRMKFVGYTLQGDQTTLAGLPLPIHEGVKTLKAHVYTSLAEMQIQKEEEIARNPFSTTEGEIEMTPTEILYQAMLPNLPQHMIALLKILLAAAPTSKSKTDSINIMSDVIPEEMPMTVLQSMKLGIDVSRHKEIIVKAVSGILLLLLKHFKLNHVYQFEFMSQHLVFANCLPLVLKFFNQNIMAYVGAKNGIPILDFPSCVIGDQPELTAENLEIGDAAPFSWRNMYSCVNLLRILNKLTKWKHSRIMMLVVFKSAPILKRTLKVRHAMTQLYVLKLLKMQTKYLGRQWRKSNMKTISAIYSKVRHRLNDDWAFGNDLDARPWDFQAEECALRASVDRFNNRRYSHTYDSDYEPVDNCINSVLGQPCDLSDTFKKNYELWLEQEVFQDPIDWDTIVLS